ncbi:MAG: antitoxin Xre/MbcA/ParS toxin-binding domain-containing protein [Geminicoccaceae bacterium]
MRQEGVTARLQRVRLYAVEVFEDEEDAKEWLHRPNPALDGQRPIVMAETEEGEKLVRMALGRIDHGVYT